MKKLSEFNAECPFHDGEARLSVESYLAWVDFHTTHSPIKMYVVCRTCGATGPYSENAVEAVSRWNNAIKKKGDDYQRSTQEKGL